MPEPGLTFDRATVRTIDHDGRLHVAVSNISKANVCGYYGREIPGGAELGLEPDRLYQMFRDPEELAKAAPTFNGLPLTSRHVPMLVDDPQKHVVVGSTGTDAEFAPPYLRNSLVVWDGKAINAIQSDEQRELSCSYWYRPDMTPGEYEGVRYDGVMRDIKGNHVALVPDGRAGNDVLVMDGSPDGGKSPTPKKEPEMTKKTTILTPRAAVVKGALFNHLRSKLANDASPAALNDALNDALVGVGAGNWTRRRKGLPARLVSALKPAMDADLADLDALLDVIVHEKGSMEAAEVDPDQMPPLSGGEMDQDAEDEDGDLMERVKAALEKKLAPDVLAAVLAALDPAAPDYVPADEDKEKEVKADIVTKAAMDAAVTAATKATEDRVMRRVRDLRTAERVVRPLVGDLDVLAMDSDADVYKFALDQAGVKTAGVHPSAFAAMVGMLPGKGATTPAPRLANDAANVADFHKRFPTARRFA